MWNSMIMKEFGQGEEMRKRSKGLAAKRANDEMNAYFAAKKEKDSKYTNTAKKKKDDSKQLKQMAMLSRLVPKNNPTQNDNLNGTEESNTKKGVGDSNKENNRNSLTKKKGFTKENMQMICAQNRTQSKNKMSVEANVASQVGNVFKSNMKKQNVRERKESSNEGNEDSDVKYEKKRIRISLENLTNHGNNTDEQMETSSDNTSDSEGTDSGNGSEIEPEQPESDPGKHLNDAGVKILGVMKAKSLLKNTVTKELKVDNKNTMWTKKAFLKPNKLRIKRPTSGSNDAATDRKSTLDNPVQPTDDNGNMRAKTPMKGRPQAWKGIKRTMYISDNKTSKDKTKTNALKAMVDGESCMAQYDAEMQQLADDAQAHLNQNGFALTQEEDDMVLKAIESTLADEKATGLNSEDYMIIMQTITKTISDLYI